MNIYSQELIYNAFATIFILTASIGSIAYIAKCFTTNDIQLGDEKQYQILQILKVGSAVKKKIAHYYE